MSEQGVFGFTMIRKPLLLLSGETWGLGSKGHDRKHGVSGVEGHLAKNGCASMPRALIGSSVELVCCSLVLPLSNF